MKKTVVAGFLLSLFFLSSNAFAGLIFFVEEVGSNIKISVSGSLDTSGWSRTGEQIWNSGLTYIRPRTVTVGSGNFSSISTSSTFFTAGGASSTQVFASGPSYQAASQSSGDYVTFQLGGSNPLLNVPFGYISGNPLSGTATYTGQSLSSLGMSSVTTWKWYLGANGDDSKSITVTAVPEPGSLAVVGGLVVGLSVLNRRRRQA